MRKNKFLTFISLAVFIFLFFPLLIITVTAFGTENTISFPIKGFTFNWFIKALSSKTFIDAFALSFKLAFISTLIALIIGIPAAYAMSRYSLRGKKLLKSFFLSPTIVPGIVIGYSLFQFLVIKLQLPVFQGLLFGHFLVVLPYIIRIVGASLEQFDFSIEEVAWSLGCNKFTTFFFFFLPNISSGIFSSFLLAFIIFRFRCS